MNLHQVELLLRDKQAVIRVACWDGKVSLLLTSKLGPDVQVKRGSLKHALAAAVRAGEKLYKKDLAKPWEKC